jgi:tRNA wybutosine-synthesizing protein 1
MAKTLDFWTTLLKVIKSLIKTGDFGPLSSLILGLPTLSASHEQEEGFLKSGKIFYGTQKGTSKRLAHRLARKAKSFGLDLTIVNMADYEVEKLPEEKLAFFIISTYTDGTAPEPAQWFCRWLEESAHDFRCGADFLKNLTFSVFGCGNSLYGPNFNKCSIDLTKNLKLMGAKEIADLFQGDEDKGSLDLQLNDWNRILQLKLSKFVKPLEVSSDPAANGRKGGKQRDSKVKLKLEKMREQKEKQQSMNGSNSTDIEDIGRKSLPADSNEKPKMLNETVTASLKKQGYKIIGSHSGVKLCRWTKSMLRGRGGCYKHTFYGIASHRCIEATPSLACANKCVFCWRHHTNPIGKEWKWDMDPPDQIVRDALSYHRGMIKEMRGVPGVKPERMAEGIDVKHCALSLVGEPIMYPEINELCNQLHNRGISSFMVTNAQFPDAIERLVPVTQLYVSVDAATKDSLKAIDRPLFSDFWERFLLCLQKLRTKQQRTVYRLTLVNEWNMAEVEQYANLVDIGKPDFIEIKGVTYCGTNDASSLTIKSVPYHKQVRAFGEEICKFKGEYGLACEHEHSLSILLARKDRYLKKDKWYTWIDYERFQELYRSGKPFGAVDYMAETPSWATYGSEEKGFDPEEVRFRKVRNHPNKNKKEEASAEPPVSCSPA